MNEHKDEGLSDALLHLIEEEREEKGRCPIFPLMALLVSGLLLSFFSFLLYKEDMGGAFLEAKEAFADFWEGDSALAVFLGMDEASER